jgi:hypothetical protein
VKRLNVGSALADAATLYRMLFARSVLVAAVVYGAVALLRLVDHAATGTGTGLLGLIVLVATIAGPALVEGCLVELVRNIHEARPPPGLGPLFAQTRSRLPRLVGASLVYAFGVALGFIALIVPGLVALTRWSLMPPVIVLEDRSVWPSRERSRELVRGAGVPVLACLLVSWAVTLAVPVAVLIARLSFGTSEFASFVWSTLTAPFTAHVLTVLYYRLAEPDAPVIHPGMRGWRAR